MFNALKPSRIAFFLLIFCILSAVLFTFADGILHGRIEKGSLMAMALVSDFRYLFEQGIYAATIFWAAAKFTETRTVLSVGFDRLDASRMSVRGPDETNTVWIGRRYEARLEAEAVATAFEVRIQDAQNRPYD